MHENVGPKRSWHRAQFKRGKSVRNNQIAQIAEENVAPRRQLDQKPEYRSQSHRHVVRDDASLVNQIGHRCGEHRVETGDFPALLQ